MASNNTPQKTNRITDSVIAINQIVLGNAAPTAMASMYVTMAQAAGIGAQNTVSAQNHLNILGTAAVAAGTGNLLWEGLTRQVDKMTIEDRLKYWNEMMSISSGHGASGSEDGAADEGNDTGSNQAEGSPNDNAS